MNPFGPRDSEVSPRESERSSRSSVTATVRGSQAELWERTDRLLRFPARSRLAATSARSRWIRENDIRTDFQDGGIGCCWFAQQGDGEPVPGETEAEAIDRLIRANDLPAPAA